MHTTCSMKCHNELKSMKMQNKLPGTLLCLNVLLLDSTSKIRERKRECSEKGRITCVCNFARDGELSLI